MKLDIKIYGTTKRKEQILKNKELLKLSDNDVFMIEPDGKWPWVLTKKAFTQPVPEGVTHRLVLQDDAELCPDFLQYANMMINTRPDDVFFLVALDYQEKYDCVENLESPYIKLHRMVQGCAIIMPVKYIKRCFNDLVTMYPGISVGEPHEDTAIILWCDKNRIPVTTTVPSIAQHIGDHSSLFGYVIPTRTAYFGDWEKAHWDNPKRHIINKTITFKPSLEYKYDIKVYGVKKREDNIRNTQKILGLSDDDIFFDDRPNGGTAFYTAKKTWNLPVPEGITHRICLQDDIELCDNFKEIVQQMIETHPNAIINLTASELGLRDKDDNFKFYKEFSLANTPYIKPIYSTGCALIIPVQYIKYIWEWCYQYGHEDTDEDVSIMYWARQYKIPYISVLPSIINHIGNESLIHPEYPVRRCEFFRKHPVANWRSKDVITVYNDSLKDKKV